MNVIFAGNYARNGGGISMAAFCAPILVNCTFWNNSANHGGGAVKCQQSYPTFTNCTFVGNRAHENGGALLCGHLSSMTLENCLIAFNGPGTAIWIENPIGRGPVSEMFLTSCNIFGNGTGDWTGYVSGQYGTGCNISEDPLLCDSQGGDLRLQEDSPCAPFSPPGEACDLIGAWPVGCAPPETTEEAARGGLEEIRR